jgi:formylglycine-generating enzyme
MMTSEQKYKKIHELEWELTKLAIAGTGLQIPDASGNRANRQKALNLADAIQDFSEGKNEVIWDYLNRPSVMYVVHPDKMSRVDILSKGSTLFTPPSNVPIHPAFLVNDKVIKKLYLPKYVAGRSEGVNYPVSLFGLFPAHTISYDSAVASCRTASNASVVNSTASNNIHMLTQAEIGYLINLSAYHNFECDGNDSYGRPYNRKDDFGQPAMSTGDDNSRQIGRVACGSMSMRCNHDGSPFGIQLRNGLALWKGGYTTYGGEIRVGKYNNFACPWADHSLGSTWWQTFLDGNLYGSINNADSMKWDYINDAPTSGSGSYELVKTITHQQATGDPYGGSAFSSLSARTGVTIPTLMRLYGIMPMLTNNPKGHTWMRNYASQERVACGLGYWSNASNAGWGYSNGDDYSRSNAYGSIGFAVASFEQETNI